MVNKQVAKIGISDMAVVKAPQVLKTVGLGSCIGVVIYDEGKKVAGMAHIMLPNSSSSRMQKLNVAKYADTAIEALYKEVLLRGGRERMLKAKYAGGAQMFTFTSSNESMRIGERNSEAVYQHLNKFGIKIVGYDTGGNKGRTIEFDTETSLLCIKAVNQNLTYL